MANNKDFKVKNGIQPTVYHEAVGTVVSSSVGYSFSNFIRKEHTLSVGSEYSILTDLTISYDGSKLYANGTDENVYQYDLVTPFDISTASYSSKSYYFFNETAHSGITVGFSVDGTRMYLCGAYQVSPFPYAIWQYDLSTAWDVSTAVYDAISNNLPASRYAFFKPDGTKFYAVDDYVIRQVSLSTAWDVTTDSNDNKSLDLTSDGSTGSIYELNLTSDGYTLYVFRKPTGDYSGLNVDKYTLSTAWDISTATNANESYTIDPYLAGENRRRGVSLSPDGKYLYAIGYTQDQVTESTLLFTTKTLDLSTGNVFEVTPTSNIQVSLTNPAASGTSSGATLLLDGAATNSYDIANASYDNKSFLVSSENVQPNGVAFSNSGTKMFIAGGIAPDTVFQYSLSSAWDVSTSSYDSVSLDVSGQTGTGLSDLTFNNDGTKMYVCSTTPDVVYQYSLTTPFDLSTASYDSVSASVTEATSPQGLCFSSDGLKLLVLDTGSNRVEPYSLTTAFDISDISYDGDFLSVGVQDNNVQGIAINEDGTKVFVAGRENTSVYEYTLTTANDVTSGSYSGNSFDFSSEESLVGGLFFGRKATKMYLSGNTNDSVYQYTVGTEATITYDSALQWSGGTAPTSPAADETDVLTFNTTDGGTTYQAVQAIDGAK